MTREEAFEIAADCVPGLQDRFGWIPRIADAIIRARNDAFAEAEEIASSMYDDWSTVNAGIAAEEISRAIGRQKQ